MSQHAAQAARPRGVRNYAKQARRATQTAPARGRLAGLRAGYPMPTIAETRSTDICTSGQTTLNSIPVASRMTTRISP